MNPPQFSIITPSFRSIKWLPLNVSSVSDQTGVDHEHIVQDSCSDDGTPEWLKGRSELRSFVEKDSGMYDAVNRGFRRAQGEFLSYLNCDEQYLPGTLERVCQAFTDNPETEVVLGACIVVDEFGTYRCDRRVLEPTYGHTLVGENLSFLTAGCFIRRRFLEEHRLYFDPSWRMAGDAEWAARVVRAGAKFTVLEEFVAVFTLTGQNMMFSAKAQEETRRLALMAPLWMRMSAPLLRFRYRLQRVLAGHHLCRRHSYSIYTLRDQSKRSVFEVTDPRWRWR